MNLTQELRSISDRTTNRIKRKKEKGQMALSKKQKEEAVKEAEEILKGLPAELKNSANKTDDRKYEVMQIVEASMPFGKKFNHRDLRGVARMVFTGCKKLGLDVRVESSEYDNGMTGVSCAGIWVYW